MLSTTENRTKEDRTATVEFQKKDGTEVLAKLTVNQTAKVAVEQQQTAEKTHGSVKISSTPSGASIWIDGKDTKKTTPEIIEDLTVGGHKLVLKMSGYEDASGRTTVKENERSELTLTLISSHSNNDHEWVDLGLSVKWATCNVGASTASDYGSYFAWGETGPKRDYSWENLKYRTSGDRYVNVKFSKYVADSMYGTVDNKTVLDLSDDAARSNWGGSWRMPTESEFRELMDKCTWTWTTMNGKNGYKVVSKVNGNSIFLPAAGDRNGTSLYSAGRSGHYWSSSLNESPSYYARSLYFGSDYHSTFHINRRNGLPVRPVLR